MKLTKDGRKVQAIYTGNVVNVYVDEYKDSHYAKVVMCLGPGFTDEYYREIEQQIADNGGELPAELLARRHGPIGG